MIPVLGHHSTCCPHNIIISAFHYSSVPNPHGSRYNPNTPGYIAYSFFFPTNPHCKMQIVEKISTHYAPNRLLSLVLPNDARCGMSRSRDGESYVGSRSRVLPRSGNLRTLVRKHMHWSWREIRGSEPKRLHAGG